MNPSSTLNFETGRVVGCFLDDLGGGLLIASFGDLAVCFGWGWGLFGDLSVCFSFEG